MCGNVWIWGYSDIGRLVHRVIRTEQKVCLKGIIDNSPQKIGTYAEDIMIRSFDEAIVQVKPEETVICCCYRKNQKIFAEKLESCGHQKYLFFDDLDFRPILFRHVEQGYDSRLISRCCTQEDFENDAFYAVSEHFRKFYTQYVKYDRKLWEWAYIVKVLEQFDMLREGKSGLGFAVGCEPLPAYFASQKVCVLATDLSEDEPKAQQWAKTGQNALGNREILYLEGMCSREDFDRYVSYRSVNMNDMPADIGEYDFCWSSCAIEHVGSLEQSKQFLKNMITKLKPGGIAVHTTEFNLVSNEDTSETGDNAIYRRRDLEEMRDWFLKNGCRMEISFQRGTKEGDLFVDIPEYRQREYHLNLSLEGYVTTSFAIVVQKEER